MEYDYAFYERAWRFWTTELYPELKGMLSPEAKDLAKKTLEEWIAAVKPEAGVICKITNNGNSLTAEIQVPDDLNNEIHVYPLCGGPHTLIKLS